MSKTQGNHIKDRRTFFTSKNFLMGQLTVLRIKSHEYLMY
jgi:hypothetical protein